MIENILATLPRDLAYWTLLGAYEASDQEYGRFCVALGLEANTEQAEDTYAAVHDAYSEMWLALGSDVFFARLEPYARQWRRRGSEGTGIGALVTRLRGGRA